MILLGDEWVSTPPMYICTWFGQSLVEGLFQKWRGGEIGGWKVEFEVRGCSRVGRGCRVQTSNMTTIVGMSAWGWEGGGAFVSPDKLINEINLSKAGRTGRPRGEDLFS